MFHMWEMPLGIGGWWIFGGLWMVVFWGGLVALVVWGINKLTGRSDAGTLQKPLEIIKERYARGEISRPDYERIKKDLV